MIHPAPIPPRYFRRAARLARWMIVLLPLMVSCSPHSDFVEVTVVDAALNTPIAGAVVTTAGQVLHTDDEGVVAVNRQAAHLSVRAIGHWRVELDNTGQRAKVVVALPQVTPKALYLSFYGVGDRQLRENALRLIHDTQLNALVIDVKDDRGHITFRSALPLASTAGAQKVVTVRDMAGLIASLHKQGIYTIARVATFKDNLLARSRPNLAIHTGNGGLWLDRDGMAWTDPFRREVWDYNIGIAVEAARYGFDEIQFDYLRFPERPEIRLSKNSTQKSRVTALAEFLSAAAKQLAPYNVFVAADMFGYTLWNQDDTGVGQRLEELAPHLDYISPMLYPSSFQFGIPGYSDPVAHPHETVILSLANARRRTNLSSAHFRPWLQAFDDYAYDHRHFGAAQISAQIRAAEQFGSNGWMLWNPRNAYTADGLRRDRREWSRPR